MKDKKHFYERSNLLESDVNITFEQLLWMNDSETTDWIDKMRSFILSQWDGEGIPPTIGQSEEKIKSNQYQNNASNYFFQPILPILC